MVDGVGTTKYTYSASGQMLTEDGPFASDTVTNTYWNRLRVNMNLQQPTGVWTNQFGYDYTRRLLDVTSPAGEFDYQYQDGLPSKLVQKLSLPNTSYITNTYDGNARVLGTYLKNSSDTTLDSAAYGYNKGNQRVTWTNASGTHVSYAYDGIGQLTNDTGTGGYAYDAAWNLEDGFSVDEKNQLTSGPNGAMFGYDANGNLTQQDYFGVDMYYDFFQYFSYDDENRLTSIEWDMENVDTLVYFKREQFAYDGLGRLRQRIECEWDGEE